MFFFTSPFHEWYLEAELTMFFILYFIKTLKTEFSKLLDKVERVSVYKVKGSIWDGMMATS